MNLGAKGCKPQPLFPPRTWATVVPRLACLNRNDFNGFFLGRIFYRFLNGLVHLFLLNRDTFDG